MDVKKEIDILADTIQGEINRMCVTDDIAELNCMALYAKKNVDRLHKMVYEKRISKPFSLCRNLWGEVMTNKSNIELLQDLIYYGHDYYYEDLWQETMIVLAKRLGIENFNPYEG